MSTFQIDGAMCSDKDRIRDMWADHFEFLGTPPEVILMIQTFSIVLKFASMKCSVKLIQRVKIAHSFLQSVSHLFCSTIFELAYVVLYMAVKEFFVAVYC